MWPNPQSPADLVSITEEIFSGKLHFLCAECFSVFQNNIAISPWQMEKLRENLLYKKKKNKKKQTSLGHHFVLMFLHSVPIFRCSNDGYESWRLNAMYWYFLKYPLKDRGVCRTLSDNCDRTFFTVYKTDLQQRRSVFQITTAWKVSKYVVISGPYFPVFGLNTSPYSIRIQGNTDQK